MAGLAQLRLSMTIAILARAFADKAVKEGKVDLVAVSRALLADPEWAMKAVKTLKKT